MKTTHNPLWLAALLVGAFALTACDDDDSAEDPGTDMLIIVDDDAARPDTAIEEDAAVQDAAPQPEDAAADMQPPDATPVILEEPEALIYLQDPVTDEGQLSRVVLPAVTTPDGRLTSPSVEVFNCLNEPGGVQGMIPGIGITVSLCHEVQVARPGPNGHYDHIAPPEDDRDPNDSFSELMMYHHVNRVHDYFKDTFGFTDMDFPLPALVNVQFKTDPPLPIPGIMPGPDGWIPFANAAFFPRENWELFAQQFGLPPRDSDSIIFFQDQVDFAYDAPVIYHEYTHAVVGTGRLQAQAVPDEYGLDNSSASMNEGIADYFAASLADNPVIGAYVANGLGVGGGLRDVSSFRGCPNDTIDEVHAQGQIIGSTMWDVREAIGAEAADQIAFNGLMQFTESTTHREAGALFRAEAAAISPEIAAQVDEVLTEHGFGECVRSLPFVRFNAEASRDRIPHLVEGRQSLGFGGFNETGVPAYKQFHINLPVGTPAVALRWGVQANAFFGGSPAAPLVLALRQSEPIRFDYSDGVTMAHDFQVTPALANGEQRIVLAGGCLPPDGEALYTLFLNTSADQLAVPTMDIEYLDAVPEGGEVQVFTCGDN
ncbi:MAG: hypothetical protein KC620_04705 [Myxococcales bacterium]|nr:hypothetical protein [Myxococcales bacterium]